MIINSSIFLPVPIVSTITDVNNAMNVLMDNIQKVNNYGLGMDSPIFTPIHPSVDTTINCNLNGQFQVIGVRSSTSALTMTLPLYSHNIIEGANFYFYDETGNASTYNITINTNGNKINGSTSNKTINANYGYLWILCYKKGISDLEFIILSQNGVV
jgi:hypothetical protein